MAASNQLYSNDFINVLQNEKIRYKDRCILGYLNINSFRNKHRDLNDVFNEMLIDLFAIAETKLDNNFLDGEFEKPNYKLYRRDRPIRGDIGGGILVYVNVNIPSRRIHKLECENFDTIALELNIAKRRWLCISIYRSPSDSLSLFLNELESILDKAMNIYDNVVIQGDFNVNMLKDTTYTKRILNLCNTFDMKNIIKSPTCFKHGETLIDLILTNRPKSFLTKNVICTGLSDFHSLIYGVLPGSLPKTYPKYIQFRSYRKFNTEEFLADIQCSDLYHCADYEDAHKGFHSYLELFQQICNSHAPIKKKKSKRYS